MACVFAAHAPAQADGTLEQRLDALEAQVVAGEDIAAIKRLQRQYGYYVAVGTGDRSLSGPVLEFVRRVTARGLGDSRP
jgi:hypothetical protein